MSGLIWRIIFGGMWGFSLAGFITDIIEGENLYVGGTSLGIVTAIMLAAVLREAAKDWQS